MDINDLIRILTGNGDIKQGLLYKVDQNEMSIMEIKESMKEFKDLLSQNNSLLKSSLHGKTGKPILGIPAHVRDKAWMYFIRLVATYAAAAFGIDKLLN